MTKYDIKLLLQLSHSTNINTQKIAEMPANLCNLYT